MDKFFEFLTAVFNSNLKNNAIVLCSIFFVLGIAIGIWVYYFLYKNIFSKQELNQIDELKKENNNLIKEIDHLKVIETEYEKYKIISHIPTSHETKPDIGNLKI